MHLMRYVGEIGTRADATLDYDLEIQNIEADSDSQLTVYCTNGWYFTLTREDMMRIVAARRHQDSITWRISDRRKLR